MVVQRTVTPPASATTGSIPVHSTKSKRQQCLTVVSDDGISELSQIYSSVAQLVEYSTVNAGVGGSNPPWGASFMSSSSNR